MSGRRLLVAVAAWVLLTGAGLGAAVLALRLLGRPWASSHGGDAGALVLLESYLGLLGALALAFGGAGGVRDRLGFRFTSGSDLALTAGVWIGTLAGAALVTAATEPLLGRPDHTAVGLVQLSRDPLAVTLIVPTVCLLGPAAEELLFRGALYGWLRRRVRALWAVPLTAVVFATAHLAPSSFPALFVFGLGAGWVRERTGSTLNSFVLHASQNTLALWAAYALLSR